MEIYRELLLYNPLDPLGLRETLANLYQEAGRWEAMVELAGRYQDDSLPAILYGKPLALFKLGRKGEAEDALKLAVSHLPEVGKGIVEGKGGEGGRWWDREARGWLEGVLAGQ